MAVAKYYDFDLHEWVAVSNGGGGDGGGGGGGASGGQMMEGVWEWLDDPVGDSMEYQGDGRMWYVDSVGQGDRYGISFKDMHGADHSLALINLTYGDVLYGEEGPDWDTANGDRVRVTDLDWIDNENGDAAALIVTTSGSLYWGRDGQPFRLAWEFGSKVPQGSFRWAGPHDSIPDWQVYGTMWSEWWGSIGGTINESWWTVPLDATHLFFSIVDMAGIDTSYLIFSAQVGDLIRIASSSASWDTDPGNTVARVTGAPWRDIESAGNALWVIPVEILQVAGKHDWDIPDQLSVHPAQAGGGSEVGQKWYKFEPGDFSNGWDIPDFKYVMVHRTGGIVTISGVLDGSAATGEIFMYWGNYAANWARPTFHATGTAVDSSDNTYLVYFSGYTPGRSQSNPDPDYYEFTGLAVRGGAGAAGPLHFSITYSTKRDWDAGGPT